MKPSVMPAYFMLKGYVPTDEIKQKMYIDYARKYTAGIDFSLLVKNFQFLGGF
jgi:hypothetical protein